MENTPSGPFGPFVVPTEYWVELTVDGEVIDKGIRIRKDPRIDASDQDLRMQYYFSKKCYDAYHVLESYRNVIDAVNDPSSALKQFRGNGAAGNPDTMYGSITHTPADRETVVGLQHKFLFMMNLIQSADVMPTSQTQEGVKKLEATLKQMQERWKTLVK